jgi:hypothetical protein
MLLLKTIFLFLLNPSFIRTLSFLTLNPTLFIDLIPTSFTICLSSLMKLEILLLFLLVFLTRYFLLLTITEFEIERTKKDLIVTGTIDREHDIDFKLTFNENRPMIKEKARFFPYWCCKSFSTSEMKPSNVKYCRKDGKAFLKSYETTLTLKHMLSFRRIQLISTQDESASKRGRYSGILGINPFDLCNVTKLDPNSVINKMRKDNSGFTINLPYLSFRSSFTYHFAAPLDGIFFEIKAFMIGNIFIVGNFKAKIDLDSNQCKIPARLFTFAQGFDYQQRLKGKPRTKFIYFLSKKDEFWFQFPSGDKLELPFGEKKSISADLLFSAHEENYISLGLLFLDHFSVSFDLVSKKIYFREKFLSS